MINISTDTLEATIMRGKSVLTTSGDQKLITLLSKAHVWFEDLKSGNALSIDDIATAENMNASDVSRYLPLAFLDLGVAVNRAGA